MRRASPSSGPAPRRRRHRPIRRRWREWHKSACGLSFTGAHRPDRIGQRLTSGERVKHERCTGRHRGALKEQALSEEAAPYGWSCQCSGKSRGRPAIAVPQTNIDSCQASSHPTYVPLCGTATYVGCSATFAGDCRLLPTASCDRCRPKRRPASAAPSRPPAAPCPSAPLLSP